MNFRENPALGRKVFFVNPPFVIEKKVIEWLRELEYEVYIIRSYENAKPVLRNCENAICFINIDEQLSIKGWYNFIKSFQIDSSLKTIFLGIMSAKAGEAQISKFIMNLRLPGGYISLSNPSEDILTKFNGILELNGAKGERKVVRLNCDEENVLNGYIAYGSKLYAMTVKDISTIGITCALDKDLSTSLKKNTLLNNVSLSLGRWSVITQCVVLSIKSFEDKIIAILFFIKETPKEVKTSVRHFIFDVLTKRLDEYMKNSVKDTEDYSDSKAYEGIGSVPDYDAPTEADNVTDETIDEVEEIEADQEKPAPEAKLEE